MDHKLLTDTIMDTLSMSLDDKSFLFFFQETSGISFEDFIRVKIVENDFGSFAALILLIKKTHEKYLFDSNVDEEW
ncbi:MAG: hypothetical protein Q8T08_14440 [Ignavibacteria bacterium]|nr:hypothetical protein [Ignavibacteria bacterium]